MTRTDPFMIFAAIAVVAVFLAPLASRLVASASARLSAELSVDPGADLSRIRPRRRRGPGR